jgi:hypothetical protein
MVRQGPVVSLALGAALASFALAADAAKPGGSGASASKAASKAQGEAKADAAPKAEFRPAAKATTESLDRRPYKIRAWVAVDPRARLDEVGRDRLISGWQGLVRRFVGAPWDLEVAAGDGPLATETLEALKPSQVAPLAADCDKAWIIQIEAEDMGFAFTAREYDVVTRRLGPACRRPAPFPADASRALLVLSQDIFAPTAEIGPKVGGGVQITVRGASLPAASPAGRIVKPGSVFKPLRIYYKDDGTPLKIEEIRRSFLRVLALDGPIARCDIVSSLRDPLSGRVVRKNALVALGVKPASIPTRLRYIEDGPDKRPVAGHTLTAKTVPDGTPQEVGTTDREGRVSVESGFSDGLVIFRLLAANIEPIDEFPAMPGETLTERTVVVRLKPETVALETELNSLRDELIDLVATRARIESRLKARAEGDKWDEVETLLDEYRKLTPRDEYVNRLAKLKDDAAHRQAETKKAILTKTAQTLVTDTQALIDRYLDDDMFKAYADALGRYKADGAAQAKTGLAHKEAQPRGWKTFAPAGQGYSVLVPGTPVLTQTRTQSPFGEVNTTRYVADNGRNESFSVAFNEVPDSDRLKLSADERLERVREALSKTYPGQALGMEKIKVDGRPGSDFRYETSDTQTPGQNLVQARYVLVDNGFYLLSHSGPAASPSQDARTFLSSFRLTSSAPNLASTPPPAPTTPAPAPTPPQSAQPAAAAPRRVPPPAAAPAQPSKPAGNLVPF